MAFEELARVLPDELQKYLINYDKELITPENVFDCIEQADGLLLVWTLDDDDRKNLASTYQYEGKAQMQKLLVATSLINVISCAQPDVQIVNPIEQLLMPVGLLYSVTLPLFIRAIKELHYFQLLHKQGITSEEVDEVLAVETDVELAKTVEEAKETIEEVETQEVPDEGPEEKSGNNEGEVVSEEEITPEISERQKKEEEEDMDYEKIKDIMEKVVDGKLEKFKEEKFFKVKAVENNHPVTWDTFWIMAGVIPLASVLLLTLNIYLFVKTNSAFLYAIITEGTIVAIILMGFAFYRWKKR